MNNTKKNIHAFTLSSIEVTEDHKYVKHIQKQSEKIKCIAYQVKSRRKARRISEPHTTHYVLMGHCIHSK